MNNKRLITGSYFNAQVKKLNAPYDIYKFDCKDIFSVSEALKLRKALLTMKFKKKSCDLYSFSQSSDFNSLKSSQMPEELKHFLSILDMIKLRVAAFLGKKFNNVISVSCSKYDQGDYLLCHDDRVDDRSVAFIYYLNCDWLNEWGGTLDVYSVDEEYNAKEIAQSINPEINSLIFFPVGRETYHQVSENVSNFSRISINGWFHCSDLDWEMCDQKMDLVTPFYLPIKISDSKSQYPALSLSSVMYDDPLFRESMKDMFDVDSFILCAEFFNQNVVDNLSNELFMDNLQWQIKGPLNKRQYKFLLMENLPDQLLFIVNMLKTDYMINFLEECTGLQLLAVNIQVQKWHGGHYIVSGRNDGVNGLNILSAYLFFTQCFENSSAISNNEDDLHFMFESRDLVEKKFGCKPQNNTLFLVHRTPNMDSFVNYCKKISGYAWTVVIAHYLIKGNDPHVDLEQ